MNKYRIQSGLSLIEMVAVVAVVGVLAVIATPAVKGLYNSMVNESGTRTMISSALANARSIALSRGKYAGVRFQQDTKGNQYMIFVVHIPETDSFFKAVEGKQPIKLPDNFRVMDLKRRTDYGSNNNSEKTLGSYELDEGDISDTGNLISSLYSQLNKINKYVFDSTTFTIVFSPSGKVVVRQARMRNRDGVHEPVNLNESRDDIFNSTVNIFENRVGMFIQDDYPEYGLGNEYSRRYFVIYDRNEFKQMDGGERYDYLFYKLKPVYVNAYSGKLVNRD